VEAVERRTTRRSAPTNALHEDNTIAFLEPIKGTACTHFVQGTY